MISSKFGNSQWSDWSIPLSPLVSSQNTQSSNTLTQNNTNAWSDDAVQNHSQAPPKTKSNFSCQPLQWWSSLSPILRGILLGALTNCVILVIILPIWLVKPSNTTTLAPVNTPSLRWSTTGITIAGITGVMGTAANQLNMPCTLTFDWSNTLYVADEYNNRIQKFLIGEEYGTTIAGQINGQSGIASNEFNAPTGIYVDSNGDIFIADTNNNRIQYWSNGAVSGETLVGNGTAGFANNLLYNPYGICRDENSGTLYVADTDNHRIMRYNNNGPSGDIIAGGNGPGTATTQLYYPSACQFDSLSNSLLIANSGVNNIVRWIIGASNWTLVAGNINGQAGGSATLLTQPSDAALDPMGNVYVVDRQNHRIQFFLSNQSSGVTIAGVTGSSGNTSTLLNYPTFLGLDSQLNLYVADQNNHRIQKFLRY